MTIDIDSVRQAIIDQPGHILVCGGPGSGKTTIALLKARERSKVLDPGQSILFLSFSRAAVRQVIGRCKSVLNQEERRLLEVKTYHAFCLEILKSHGKLLVRRQCRFILPADELILRASFPGDWETERQRRAAEEGSFCFDLFAWGVATLFQKSIALRHLYGSRHPLVVIDEFQDTDDDQWRVVLELSKVTDVFCLADPDQRIFEYRPTVDPKRLDILRNLVQPKSFDLGRDNHRSRDAGILDFADAVLYNRSPLPKSQDVKLVHYYPRNFPETVHAGVVWTFSQLRKRKIRKPSVAVLARSNSLVASVSGILSEEHTYDKSPLHPVEHDVAWDADLSVASATVVGSIMAWPSLPETVAVCGTLGLIAHYFRLKNASNPSNKAVDSVRKFEGSKDAVAIGQKPKNKAAQVLVAIYRTGLKMTGDPVRDWIDARKILEQIKDLPDLYRDAKMVRLLGARDVLAAGLASLWLSSGSYSGASSFVKRILDQERLMAIDREPRGCIVMNIHKSKGKEFDGVVMVEGAYSSQFFDNKREKFPFEQSRRLFRVGVTRARTLVTVVRPFNAAPLVGK